MAQVRVTIAYDGSQGAGRAVAAAAALFPGADASIVYVPPEPPPAPQTALPTLSWDDIQRVHSEFAAASLEAAQAVVDEGVARAGGLSAAGAIAPPRSPAWRGLLEAASGSDVLVCGTRGRGGMARALLGSTSMSLLHHAPLPLLIVPDAPAGDGPAVIAYDGSDAAAHAVAVAGEVLGSAAVVVHVWESPYRHSRSGRALAGFPVDEVRAVVAGLEATLAEAAAEVTDAGVELARFAGLDARGETIDSGEGVWRAISAFAASADASVIVSGARGLGSARSALLGSVSSGLVHNAERPVLVVPA